MPKKIMVTGVYGLIAGAIYHYLTAAPDRYDVYALARRREPRWERCPTRMRLSSRPSGLP